jgi:hypothetical protein
MNPDSENFDSLRQLLALKRHEVPPPGYFDRFSRDVMARIKAGENGGTIGVDSSWFQRLLSLFDVKPIFAGAFGTAVCAFLISGVISSERTPGVGSVVPGPASTPLAAISMSTPSSTVEEQLMASNTNGASGSLFDQFSLQTAPASYLLPQ